MAQPTPIAHSSAEQIESLVHKVTVVSVHAVDPGTIAGLFLHQQGLIQTVTFQGPGHVKLQSSCNPESQSNSGSFSPATVRTKSKHPACKYPSDPMRCRW